MKLSKRASALAESETLRLFARAAALRRSGRDVLSLLEGDPEVPLPPAVARGTIAAIRAGRTRYCESSGLPELKTLLARKLRERNGIAAAPDRILVTNGAKEAIYGALQTICGPGDEVIVPRPYWVTFPESVRLAGAKPVFVDAEEDLDPSRVAAALTPRTRAVIVNSPNNPTGAVYSRAELRELARLADRRGFWILSDEAYEDLVYDGTPHAAVASLGRAAARRTLSAFTFSKSYAMTGFRVGYLIGDPEVVRAASRLHGHVTGNVCTFAQLGAAAALRLGRAPIEERRRALERRRDVAVSLARPLFDVAAPAGGLFLWADVRRHLRGRFRTSAELAAHLLDAGVAAVPGSACGCEGYLRISFSGPEPRLREAFGRIGRALSR